MKKVSIFGSIISNTKCDSTLTALLSQPISDFRENRRMKTRANEVLRKQRYLVYLCSSNDYVPFLLQLMFGKHLLIFEVASGKSFKLRSHRMEQIFLISYNLLVNKKSLKNF